jgi:hypothetical protein
MTMKKKVKKYAEGGPTIMGIWNKQKTINPDGSSITIRKSRNPITRNERKVIIERDGSGGKSKTVQVNKKGGSVKKKKK